MTSDLLHIKDKVTPCGYLFNWVEALVDAPLEQEMGVLPMVPQEQGHLFVVLQQPALSVQRKASEGLQALAGGQGISMYTTDSVLEQQELPQDAC